VGRPEGRTRGREGKSVAFNIPILLRACLFNQFWNERRERKGEGEKEVVSVTLFTWKKEKKKRKGGGGKGREPSWFSINEVSPPERAQKGRGKGRGGRKKKEDVFFFSLILALTPVRDKEGKRRRGKEGCLLLLVQFFRWDRTKSFYTHLFAGQRKG